MELRRTLAPTCALAALSAAVAAGFARVISGGAWVAPVLGAALAPHAIGLLTRRRSTTTTMGLTIAGLAAYVLWVLLPHTTTIGVPTDRTLDAASRRLDAGLLALRNETAPVAPRPGVILLAVLAVWLMAAWADYLAFRRNASIGALAPGVTLFIWIAALAPTSESPVGAAVAMVVTGAGFLALQHQVLLTRRRAAFGSGATATLPAPRLVVGALALAVAAAVIAVALAPALPGANADPLVDLRNDDRGSSTYQTSVPPLIDVAESLRRGERSEVFTVAAASPQYWRTVALDDYSDDGGGQWTLRAAGGDITHGLDDEPTGATVSQTYRIGALAERWMPAAFEPISVSLADTLVVESSRTLVTNEDAVEGLRYRVVSQPPPTDLTEAQQRNTASRLPSALQRYTELPSTLPDVVGRVAREETRGAATPYDRARLLRDYFRGPLFTYDPEVNLTDAVSATEEFLDAKRGFCVQFASTFALMARTLGIPARVAVGYTPGELDETTGRYSVTNFEAHAWPEIWLDGVGWTNQFDPTPSSALPGGSALPDDTFAGTVAPPTPGPTTPTTLQTSPPDTSVADTVPIPAPVPAPAPIAGTESGRSWTTPVLWTLLATVVVAAVIALVPFTKHARRRARQHRADPGGRVAGAWEEAVDRLRELGQPAPRTTTPAEHALSATATVGEHAARSLAAVAHAHTAAQFGAAAPTDADADAAWQDLDAFAGALGRHLPLTTRVRARLRLRSLRAPRDPRAARGERDGQLEAVGASAVQSSATND